MMKVSVVVPIYNLEFYVDRCLASLANQTCDDYEIIIVNDGSDDDSQLIIDEYVRNYPARFVSYIKENGGHGSACNFGIERATGDYVMIVDGDDFLDPDAIRYMYDKARATQCDLLVGNLLYVFSDRQQPYAPIDIRAEKLLDEADRFELYLNWSTPCGRLYRRDLFDDAAIRFLPGVLFADANFAPKTYLAAQSIYYVNKELYNYDVTRPTQSLKRADKRILDIVPALRDMLEFYKAKGEFSNKQLALMHYTARHCVAWIRRVQTLQGYPRQRALDEIFAVADEYFGDEWLRSGVVREHFGYRVQVAVSVSRRLHYWPPVWGWNVLAMATRLSGQVERLLTFARRGYARLRQRIKARLDPRMTI